MLGSSLWSARRGAVSVLFAASSIPMIGLVGIAIDFGLYNQVKSQLNMAADTAALQAARVASRAFVYNTINGAGSRDPIAEGNTAGAQWFAAQAAVLVQGHPPPPNVAVTLSGVTFTATVSYTTTVSREFGKIFNAGPWALAGTAVSKVTMNAYVDVYMALDNSGSMLIAATQKGITDMQVRTAAAPADMQKSSNQTPPTCAFACHWDAGNYDYYGLSQGIAPGLPSAAPIQLRTNVVRDAAVQVINALEAQQVVAQQFATQVYTFNTAVTTVFPTGGQQNTDLATAQSSLSVVLPPVSVNSANTNFDDASTGPMAVLTQKLTAAGDGTSRATPRKNLFLVTDGIEDYPPTGGRVQAPFDPAQCTQIKKMGINIFVLYTTYYPIPSNSWYVTYIQPYVTSPPTPDLVSQALEACASSSTDFYTASSPAQIAAAMQAMLKAAIATPVRLSM